MTAPEVPLTGGPAPAPLAVPAQASPGVTAAGREGAQRAAEELLSAAGIQLVIVVDDQAIVASAEVAVGLVEVIWRENSKAVKGLFGLTISDDVEVRARQVRDRIKELSPLEQAASLATLRRERAKLQASGVLPPREPEEEAQDAHEVFSSEIESLTGNRLRVISPSEWEKKGQAIMDAAFEASGLGAIPGMPNTLVLFDIDLHEAGLGADAGKELAVGLVKRLSPKPVLCGIISGTIPSREERKEWVSGIDMPPDGMIFISKRDLGGDPLEFVAELRRVLLSPFAIKFRDISLGVLEGAHRFAAARVKEVNVPDLVYSVIDLSHEEGVTEIDTLRRIYDSYFREEVRRLAALAADLATIVGQLRAISHIAPGAKLKTKGATWEHQRREMYDSIVEVNRLCLPVEVGDVFQFELSDDRREPYVLVTQPCDTIVRSAGKRTLTHATLAHLMDTRPHNSMHELRWFGADGKAAYVDFTVTISVPFDVLDLCALRGDGVAKFSTDDETPHGIMTGWKKRREYLKQAVEKDVDFTRGAFGTAAGGAAQFTIPVEPSHPSPLRTTVAMSGHKAIHYNCKRTDRILMPYAGAILGEFANYISHDVFEVDLARDLKP